MPEERCLGCYDDLAEGIYHSKCSKALFGTATPPVLDTNIHEVERFAQQFVSERMTVTGVQRKLSLKIESKSSHRLTIIGSLGSTFIMKPPSPEFDQMPENEDLAMHLADICGIRTARHGLLPMNDGALVYLTKRFDRQGKKKIAVEDLCQLSEILTEQKYRSSHESTGKVIRKFSSVPGDDVLRFFELVVFSNVIGNNDMHLKNFSMVTEDPAYIHLSPAYDLLSVRLLLSTKDDPEELALTLNGKKRKLSRRDFLACADTLKIPPNVSSRVFNRIISSLPKMEALIKRSFLTKEKQDELKEIISSHLANLQEK